MTPKIQMKTPLVEMDGDEMTRILWKMIKDILILPYIDLKSEYYDLGMKHRDDTDDEVTIESALATKKYGVAVKCATITANAARVKEYDLKKMWPSPNGTIRAILDGTVFRKPIMVKGIAPLVRNWEKPITIARHAFGDIYKNTELRIPAGGKAELVVTDAQGRQTRRTIHEFKGEGITQGIFNTDESIRSYAHACFDYAYLSRKTSGLPRRTRSLKSMIIASRTFSRKFMTRNIKRGMKRAGLNISILSSTMLSPVSSVPAVEWSGPARTTMATS